MTVLDRIIELNRDQVASEADPFTERRYLQFLRHFPAGTRDVLDVGCNTGRGGRAIKQACPALRLTGLDCVPERVASLDAQVYASVICGFTNAIPAEAAQIDAIIAGEFIEHLPPDLVDACLCEFFRLLRLRGMLLLTTPNPRYLKNRIGGRSVLGGAHISQHYRSNLRRRLLDIGFSDVRIRGSGRVSALLGEMFPLADIYGSYLATARKW